MNRFRTQDLLRDVVQNIMPFFFTRFPELLKITLLTWRFSLTIHRVDELLTRTYLFLLMTLLIKWILIHILSHTRKRVLSVQCMSPADRSLIKLTPLAWCPTVLLFSILLHPHCNTIPYLIIHVVVRLRNLTLAYCVCHIFSPV